MEYCVQLLEDGTLVFDHALHNDMYLGIILMVLAVVLPLNVVQYYYMFGVFLS